MIPTADVLCATRDRRKPGVVTVGFALETGDGGGNQRARQKLEAKDLDLIVLNMANEQGAGFETDTNKVTIISRTTEEPCPLLSKREVAEKVLDAAERLL